MTEWGFVLRVAPCLPMDVRVHSRGAEVESAERERGGGRRDGLYLGDCGGGVRWRLEAWKGGDMDGVV